MSTRLTNLFHALLLIALALLIGFLSTRHGFVQDWSRTQRASLGPASVELLKSLKGPVEIISYARPHGELRKTIGDFLARYSRIKPDLSLRFVDPDADPNAMRAAGVQINGEMDVRYNSRSERLRSLSETDVSSALLRLSRARESLVGFLEGEGERKPDGVANADLGQFGDALKQRGIRPVNVALSTLETIPDNLDLLVIANPRVALDAASVGKVDEYLQRGGNLLWMLEAGEKNGLDRLAHALSIRVLDGIVVDGAGQALGIEDPSMVALSAYPDHAIVQGLDLSTLFPQPVALAQITPPDWSITPFLQTSKLSWTETGHIPQAGEAEGSIRFDGDTGEFSGPLDIGLALTRLSPSPAKTEQRVVVIGDGDFISNSFIGNGGNRDLGTRIFDWLLADDALITIAEPVATDRTIALSGPALSVLSFAFLLVLPLLLAASGLWIWRRRRKR